MYSGICLPYWPRIWQNRVLSVEKLAVWVEKAKQKDEIEEKTSIVELEDDEKANTKPLITPKEIKTTLTRPGANQMT